MSEERIAAMSAYRPYPADTGEEDMAGAIRRAEETKPRLAFARHASFRSFSVDGFIC